MSHDEDHAVADQFLGGGDRLLGIAEVVRSDELHLFAEDAALGVEVGHGQRRAAVHLLTEPGKLSGHRAGDADQDLGAGRRSAKCRDRNDPHEQQSRADHD